MTTCNVGFNTQYETRTLDKCANTPFFWSDDVYGDTCDDYESGQYCNPDGSYRNWRPEWGSFDEIGNPDIHCCACGGGLNFQKPLEYVNCTCPPGSTNNNGVCIPDSANKIIRQTATIQKEICTDKSPSSNIYFNCNSVADNRVCDPQKSDRKGENWVSFMGTTLLENCCSCGGGERKIVEIPIYSVIDCPSGSIVVDGQCVCPAESTLVDGQCLCPGESTLIDGRCVCPAESTLVDGRCVCPGESTLVAGRCVCPGESTLVNGRCVCPGESTLVAGRCVCPGESTLVNGRCVCPGDSTLVNGRCVCPGDSTVVAGRCVCPGDTKLVGGQCVCNVTGAILKNGKCECIERGLSLESCEYKMVDNKCVYMDKNINKTGNKLYLLIVGGVFIVFLFIIIRVLKTSK